MRRAAAVANGWPPWKLTGELPVSRICSSTRPTFRAALTSILVDHGTILLEALPFSFTVESSLPESFPSSGLHYSLSTPETSCSISNPKAARNVLQKRGSKAVYAVNAAMSSVQHIEDSRGCVAVPAPFPVSRVSMAAVCTQSATEANLFLGTTRSSPLYQASCCRCRCIIGSGHD